MLGRGFGLRYHVPRRQGADRGVLGARWGANAARTETRRLRPQSGSRSEPRFPVDPPLLWRAEVTLTPAVLRISTWRMRRTDGRSFTSGACRQPARQAPSATPP